MTGPVTFFDHQEVAKRRSGWALLGFSLTVLFTAVSVSLFGGYIGVILMGSESASAFPKVFQFWALISGGITLSIILVSWAWKASSLASGPEGVMHSMGAWLVPTDSKEGDQRQLLNLVEEMSIASGVPVPDVYIIDSTSINACAVGMELDKAAIAVTRGAIVKLKRSELQGVIAHEYSHILHGDMALNTHMIGWLAGLFTISELGRMLISMAGDDDDCGSFIGMSARRGRGAAVLMLIGGGFWILGSIGVFFGKLLQSSLSRQREFLADASSVQYTRNPEGLANALRKLGPAAVRGRMVRPPNDCAHMMFSQLRSRNFSRSLSTHPPLAERILRILPSWDGSYLKTMELKLHETPAPKAPPYKARAENFMQEVPATLMLANLLDDRKRTDQVRLQAVQVWKSQLDPLIISLAHDPEGAQNLMCAILLQGQAEPYVEGIEDINFMQRKPQVKDLLQKITFKEKDRLGILDLALPALRQMDKSRKPSFLACIRAVCDSDGQLDLFEYCLQKILEQALSDPDNRPMYQRMRVHIRKLEQEVNVMLSSLSRLGAETSEDAARSFAKAEERMFGFTAGAKLKLLPASECGLDALDRACEKLPGLAPNFQQRLLLAGLAAIAQDDHLHPDELQAFRAFAAVMRIPVPPGLGM